MKRRAATLILSSLLGMTSAVAQEDSFRADPARVLRSETGWLPTVVPKPAVEYFNCVATIDFAYRQRAAVAEVEGTISNTYCLASSGTFVISIRVAEANGDITRRGFSHVWNRSNGAPVAFSESFDVGANVEVVSVDMLRSQCRCDSP